MRPTTNTFLLSCAGLAALCLTVFGPRKPPPPMLMTVSGACWEIPASAPDPEPAACPEGMVLVEGDYCTAVRHVCLRGRGLKENANHTVPPGSNPYFCQEWQAGRVKCLGETRPMRFCIDRHEWPNKAGVLPQVMVTWSEAQSACETAGKRLCRDDEWTLAAEGPGMLPVPYGWERDRGACNIDQTWRNPAWSKLARRGSAEADTEMARLDGRVPSGAKAGCVSAFGVRDMTGNADEWVVNHAHPKDAPGQKIGPRLLKGGHWVGGARNACRPVTEGHSRDDEFFGYAEGFRCCAGADPAAPSVSEPEPTSC